MVEGGHILRDKAVGVLKFHSSESIGACCLFEVAENMIQWIKLSLLKLCLFLSARLLEFIPMKGAATLI